MKNTKKVKKVKAIKVKQVKKVNVQALAKKQLLEQAKNKMKTVRAIQAQRMAEAMQAANRAQAEYEVEVANINRTFRSK
jgi:hypothetical protein